MVTYGPKFVAVIEGWLLYRDANYILNKVVVARRWLLYEVTTIQRFHCSTLTISPLLSLSIILSD